MRFISDPDVLEVCMGMEQGAEQCLGSPAAWPCGDRLPLWPQTWGGLALLEIVWVSCDGSCSDVES